MNFKDYSKEVKNILEEIKNIVTIKGKEYVRNDNPFHVFESASKIEGTNPFDSLDGMLLKQYTAYRDILSDLRKGKEVSIEQVNEKFGDIHVYFIIQHIQIVQHLENLKSKEL